MLMKSILCGGIAAAALAATPAAAIVSTYQADLTVLNNSGASGTATVIHDSSAGTLRLIVNASGLAPNQVHPQHLHGAFADDGSCTDRIPAAAVPPEGAVLIGACIDSSTNLNSTTPGLAQDLDSDGFVETLEGAITYGPIILNGATGLDAMGHPIFPTADAMGNLMFDQSYDLATTDLLFDHLFAVDHEPEDLFPLDLREFVIHGVIVGVDGTGDSFEVDASISAGDYVQLLPALSGDFVLISQVPEPAMLGLLGLGIIGVGFVRRRRP